MAAANTEMLGRRRTTVRCAIYTRKSTEEGLEQEFNTLDAQRDAAEAWPARSGASSRPSSRTLSRWRWT